jgi:hypothetical protein
MQKQGHIRILTGKEQDGEITRIEDIPENQIYREYRYKPLPEILDELKIIKFNRLYKPNGNDDEFLFNRELSFNLLKPRGSDRDIEKELDKLLGGK